MTKSTGKDETIVTAGIITNVRVLKSKRGDFYAQATLEDMSGTIDMIVFPEAYKRIGGEGEAGSAGAGARPVCASKRARIRRSRPPRFMPLEEAKVPLPRAIRIRVPLDTASEATIDASAYPVSRAQGRGQGVV